MATIKTDQISIRVDRATKLSAEKIFSKLGLSPTDAVRMFYRRVISERGLPFEVKVPNKATRAAMRELERGGGKTAKLSKEFYREIGIADFVKDA